MVIFAKIKGKFSQIIKGIRNIFIKNNKGYGKLGTPLPGPQCYSKYKEPKSVIHQWFSNMGKHGK